MKVTWIEEYEFSEKHFYLLNEIKKAGGCISYGFDEYDWMHKEIVKPLNEWKIYMERDEEKSYDKEWQDLCEWGFLEQSDDGSEFSYVKYILTFKARKILTQYKKGR